MNKIKALMRYESMPVIVMLGYVLCVQCMFTFYTREHIRDVYIDYLIRGVEGLETDLIDIVMWDGTGYILAMLVGIVLLIYSQFYREQEEIANFLNALPHTRRQRAYIKYGAGVSVLLIGAILFLLQNIYFYHHLYAKFLPIYRMLPNTDILLSINSIGRLVMQGILIQISFVALYTFGFMMQYVVKHVIASIGMSIATIIAPIFLLMSGEILFLANRPNVREWINSIQDLFFVPFYGIWSERGNVQETSYYYIAYYQEKIILCIIILLFSIGCFYLLTKKQCINSNEIFTGGKIVTWIFRIGFSICTGFLLGDIYFLFDEIYNDTSMLLYYNVSSLERVFVVIGLILGFWISGKIVNMNCNKKKEEYK